MAVCSEGSKVIEIPTEFVIDLAVAENMEGDRLNPVGHRQRRFLPALRARMRVEQSGQEVTILAV